MRLPVLQLVVGIMGGSISREQKYKIKVVLALAVPTIVENFLLTIVGFVDTLFVSRIGLHEVAAVGVTNAIVAIYIAVFMAMGIGTSSLIARYIGAGQMVKAQAIAGQSTWLAVIAGLIAGAISLFFAEPLLRYMGTEADVLAVGVAYFQIVAVPSVFISLSVIFGNILRSAGDTKAPMVIAIWVNLLHIGLDYLFIFGVGQWPGWGITGAAWATTLVRVFGTAALYICTKKSQVGCSLWQGLSRQYSLALLRISGPAVAERLIMRLGQLFYAGLIVKLGTDVYAAFLMAGNISYFSYMPGYGFAVAATTLVGNHVGAGRNREAYQYGQVIMWLAVVLMAVIGIGYFSVASVAGTLFTEDPGVIRMVAIGLYIDAFAQPFIAVSLVMAGALQGAGDTKSPMYSTIAGIWMIRVAGIYVLCYIWDMKITGIWLVNLIDYAIRAAFLSFKFKKRMNTVD